MTDTFKTLAQRQVPNSNTTIYTANGVQSIIRQIIVANTTGSDATIKLWVNGTADGNVILPFTSVLAGAHGEYNGAITLNVGESLSALSGTNNAITISVFGVESA